MSENWSKEKAIFELEKLGEKSDLIIKNIERLNCRINALMDQIDMELKEATLINQEEQRIFDTHLKGIEE